MPIPLSIPLHPISPKTLSAGPYDPAFIKSHWLQHYSTASFTSADLRSTRDWSGNELAFFKVHIVPITPATWEEYITPKSNLTTQKAKDLIACKLGAGNFAYGMC